MSTKTKIMMIRLTTIALLWMHLHLPLAYAQRTEFSGFTVIADLGALSDTSSYVRGDFGHISAEDLTAMRMIIPKGQVNVLVYLPEDLDPALIKKWLRFLSNRLNAPMSTVPPALVSSATQQFKMIPIMIDVDRESRNAEQINRELTQAAQALKEEYPVIESFADQAKQANSQIIEVLQQWQKTTAESIQKISENEKTKTIIFGSVLGLGSSAIPSTMLLSTVGAELFAFANIVYTIGFDQLNSAFSGHLINFEEKSRIPAFARNAVVRLYNSSFFARAVAANFAIQATYATLSRSMIYMIDPATTKSPYSIEFATSLIGIAGIGSILTSGTDTGSRFLTKKRYISPKMEVIINSTLNLFSQVNSLFLGLGHSNLLFYGLAVEWGSKGIVATLGRALPTRTPELHIFHPSLSVLSMANQRFLHDLEKSLRFEDVSAQTVLAKLGSLPLSAEREMQIKSIWLRARDIRIEAAQRMARWISGLCEKINLLTQ